MTMHNLLPTLSSACIAEKIAPLLKDAQSVIEIRTGHVIESVHNAATPRERGHNAISF